MRGTSEQFHFRLTEMLRCVQVYYPGGKPVSYLAQIGSFLWNTAQFSYYLQIKGFDLGKQTLNPWQQKSKSDSFDV